MSYQHVQTWHVQYYYSILFYICRLLGLFSQNSRTKISKLKPYFGQNSRIFSQKLMDFFCKTQFFGKSKLHQLLQVWQSWLPFSRRWNYTYNVIFHDLSLDDTKCELKLIYSWNFQWESSNNRPLKTQAIFINSTKFQNSTILYQKLKDFCSKLNISETK